MPTSVIENFYVVEEQEHEGKSIKRYILTGYPNIAEAQNYIARVDPAARRILTVKPVGRVLCTNNAMELMAGDTIVVVEYGIIYFTRRAS